MNTKHKITINGMPYDAITGLPIGSAANQAKTKAPTVTPAKSQPDVKRATASSAGLIHNHTQKSTTLKRSYLTAPTSKVPVSAPKRAAPKIARSDKIYRFAPHPEPLKTKPSETKIVGEMVFPVATKAKEAKPALTSKQVKEKLIENASRKLPTTRKAAPKTKKSILGMKSLKRSHVFAACVALLFLGGYLMFQNMPGLSMMLASSQAGIAAKFPSYSPDGYRFVGPVSYQQGEVELSYQSNGDASKGYTVTQKVSGWNSTAVLDNLVARESKGEYVTHTQGGLIVYTYGSNAAWSNGGMLYTINSSANLSNEQLLHIASGL